VTLRPDDSRKLLEKKIVSIGAEEWLAQCRNVLDVENKYIETDLIMDEASKCVVIGLGNESETDDSRLVDHSDSDEEHKISGIHLLFKSAQ
jgi:hypothetical protein